MASKSMLKASPTFGILAIASGCVANAWVATILFDSPISKRISTALESKATIWLFVPIDVTNDYI